MTVLGIIGGSGLYEIAGLQNAEWRSVETPFGAPSDALFTGTLDGLQLVFLPRHGRGHVHTPSSVPYKANICALKQLGVTDIVSLSATGSFREDMPPGDFVMVDQFIDRTFAREKSFFGPGCVAHVSVAHPTCKRLSAMVSDAARQSGANVHDGGTYLAMEGPQFSTLAESRLYREVWNCDVIGMTNMPEAKLAREAEICYAPVAMVTDFDCWHPDHDAVEVADIVRTLMGNADRARSTVVHLAKGLAAQRDVCPCGCDRALETALITAPEARDPEFVKKLQPIAGRVLN
ncbi:S-methyl-5'-thioadenosine phosphorylase [Pontivivens insulae]|uniref:S-methyl-5'-thioadenosine phosphorylase n=1 Tax=Pontivivens insulae TaxID=1639689 RepID=A0A2R8A7R8_9RHOB|nr:S-methyl-5'-thioadenosine phosphorylase [Pontivivens insulae]RED18183.1 methylthioadenosine phosphorylase [Pontivivens insulae]SPF28080.1 S-methyl-5'-thioadenosine phosphorylase [Pontivivens insulae]